MNPSLLRAVAAVALLGAGYLLGGGGLGSAFASSGTKYPDLAIVDHAPPVVSSSRDGYVVVGASDNCYYVVHADGSAILVHSGRRDVRWR